MAWKQSTALSYAYLKFQGNCELCGHTYIFYHTMYGGATRMGGTRGLEKKAQKDLFKSLSNFTPANLPMRLCPQCGYCQSWNQKTYFHTLSSFLGNLLGVIGFAISLLLLVAIGFIATSFGPDTSKTLVNIFVFLVILTFISLMITAIFFRIKYTKRIKSRFFALVGKDLLARKTLPNCTYVNGEQVVNVRDEKDWQWGNATLGEKFDYLRQILFTNEPFIDIQEEHIVSDDIQKEETLTNLPNISYKIELLIEILCCVMCADGDMAEKEQELIHKIIKKFHPDILKEDIDQQVVLFLQKVAKDNIDNVIDQICIRLSMVKNEKTKKTIQKLIKLMIKADNKIDEKEIEVYKKFKKAMGLS